MSRDGAGQVASQVAGRVMITSECPPTVAEARALAAEFNRRQRRAAAERKAARSTRCGRRACLEAAPARK